jgi:hypothetical protein
VVNAGQGDAGRCGFEPREHTGRGEWEAVGHRLRLRCAEKQRLPEVHVLDAVVVARCDRGRRRGARQRQAGASSFGTGSSAYPTP